jgi:sortase A
LFVGLAAIGWVAYVWVDAQFYQIRQRRQFDASVSAENKEPSADVRMPLTQTPVLKGPRLVKGALLGELEIPRVGLSVIVMEGDSASILRRAAGHLEGTALPGGSGNVAIAAHRDTFFHALRDVRYRDVITLNTLSGSYQYEVESIEIVEPDNMKVLADSRNPTLTLITCYPFYYIGPAPKRFIVRAHQISLDSPAEVHILQRGDQDSPDQGPTNEKQNSTHGMAGP